MKSSKFFIKSNYIKNTKNDWIYCEGKLFYHQNITFLHLKTENFEINQTFRNLGNSNYYSSFSRLSLSYQAKFTSQRLNVLCNLYQFKSCEIKSVRFENISKFAIKLVPSGFLRSKKLYLMPDIEDSLTEWCGILTGFISKSNAVPVFDSASDSRSATTVSSTMTAMRMIEDNHHQTNNVQDVYISLDENDAYETSCSDEFYLVTVEETLDSMKLDIKGNFILKMSSESLELLDVSTRETIHTFPYASIRRFGAKDKRFRLEAGRHCTTGNGSFIFQTKDAVRIAESLKSNTKKIKSIQNAKHNSCMTLNNQSASEISLQIEPKDYSTINPKNCQSTDTLLSSNFAKSQKLSFSKKYDTNENFKNYPFENEAQTLKTFSYVNSNKRSLSEMSIDSPSSTGFPQGQRTPIGLSGSASTMEEQNNNSPTKIPLNYLHAQNERMFERNSSFKMSNNNIPPDNIEIKSENVLVMDANESLTEIKDDIIQDEEISEISSPKGKLDFRDPLCPNFSESNSEILYLPPNNSFSNIGTIDRSRLTPERLKFSYNESTDSLSNNDKDQRPNSLFENSTMQTLSNSTLYSSNSPNCNSLPFPNKLSTAGYKVSESTFFKYRQQPKPPIRTTPSLNINSRSNSSHISQISLPSPNQSDSLESPKKSPPPILPKPNFKLSQDISDKSSFREFDQMLKNLNLSIC